MIRFTPSRNRFSRTHTYTHTPPKSPAHLRDNDRPRGPPPSNYRPLRRIRKHTLCAHPSPSLSLSLSHSLQENPRSFISLSPSLRRRLSPVITRKRREIARRQESPAVMLFEHANRYTHFGQLNRARTIAPRISFARRARVLRIYTCVCLHGCFSSWFPSVVVFFFCYTCPAQSLRSRYAICANGPLFSLMRNGQKRDFNRSLCKAGE